MKQFSIRDVLFLVVIVALILGWWWDRRPTPARFQMQVTTSPNRVFILDIATGQVSGRNVMSDGSVGAEGTTSPF
jgi:hypothetical protein